MNGGRTARKSRFGRLETAAIVSGVLIVGLTDNMTDSLSIHMY